MLLLILLLKLKLLLLQMTKNNSCKFLSSTMAVLQFLTDQRLLQIARIIGL